MLRARLIVVLLGITAFLTGARALGYDLFGDDPWRSRLYTTLLAAACGVAIVGVTRRAPWGRWLVLALGFGGIMTSGMNVAYGVSYAISKHSMTGVLAWQRTSLILGAGSLAFLLLARGRTMREAFGRPFTPSEPTTIWSASHPLVGAVRVALIAGFAASATSILYGLGQPVVPETATSALVLAGVFLFAALLTLARKTAGVLLIVVTGLGFLAQACATYSLASDDAKGSAAFFGVLWLSAAMTALSCGARLLKR